MDLRPLGNTGLRVSPIGLGTVKLGRNRGLKYPASEGHPLPPLPTDEQAIDLLRTAADLGVNLLDTAPAYGTSEERLGQLMHAANWLGDREHWVLCTKVGEEFDQASGTSRYDFSPVHARASVERSLRRLRTDVLDIVLVHSDGSDEAIVARSGIIDALKLMQRQGLIRAVGLSAKTLDGALLAMRTTGNIGGACDVLMLEYSPAARTSALAIDAARLRGVGVLIKKALGSGHLDDLWNKTPADLKAASLTPMEASLRLAFAKPGVSSVVLGTSRADHLRANVAACARAMG